MSHTPSTTRPQAEAAVELRRFAVAVAEPARPSGPAAAVVLAAGLAWFTLGLLSVLTAASASVSDALTFSDRVGDLSGVTTVATSSSSRHGSGWRSPGVARILLSCALPPQRRA